MRNKNLKGLVACAATAAIMAGSITAYAEGGSTTTVTVNVPVKTDYTMTIPANTAVENFGQTKLKSGLTISGTLASGYAIEVSISSQNGDESGFKFANTDKTQKIPYTLQNLSWTSRKDTANKITVQSKHLGNAIELAVNVAQDDWNAVPGGTYSDVLTFTAQTVEAGD